MFDSKNIKKYYLLGLKRTGNFLLEVKSREFLVFLFFVFVSFCFWLLQTLDDTYQTEFKIPLRLRDVPKNVVLTSEMPDEVKIRIEDRGTVLLNYMLGRTFFPIFFDFGDYAEKGTHVYISSVDITKKITAQLNSSTRLLSVRPDTLDFIYTQAKAKKVPVKLDGQVTAGRQYYISDTKFTPDSVMVYAPKEVLASIQEAYTTPIDLENVTDTVRQKVALKKMKGVKFVPSVNELSVFVDMYSEKTVEVPVLGLDFPEGKILRTFPSKVKVSFQVGLKDFMSVTADDFLIGVSYRDLLNSKEDKIPVVLHFSPGVVNHVKINPLSVDYLIEQQVSEVHD